MLLIRCPWCGERDEIEFRYGGQAHLAYPADPEALSDEEWAEFLFLRDNPKGEWAERWVHAAGCRRWFNVRRDTATYRDRIDLPDGRGAPAMTSRRVASEGRWIDRGAPISFTFDGRELPAFEGDTVASALLANGVIARLPVAVAGEAARGDDGGGRGAERLHRGERALVRADPSRRRRCRWWTGCGR